MNQRSWFSFSIVGFKSAAWGAGGAQKSWELSPWREGGDLGFKTIPTSSLGDPGEVTKTTVILSRGPSSASPIRNPIAEKRRNART